MIITGMPCTRHRVFLATLIAAAKYLNDSSPKNKHWARYAILFDTGEINLMEQQLLLLLDFDLRFDEKQAIEAFAHFLPQRTSAQEDRQTRRKALDLIKTRRSQPHIEVQLPPTPPHDAVPPSLVLRKSPSEPQDAHLSDDQAMARHKRSPASSGSSPLSTTAASFSLDSETSMGALTEDNGTSESEAEDFEECLKSSSDCFKELSSSPCVKLEESKSKTKFTPQRSFRPQTRSASYHMSSIYHRRSNLLESRIPLASSASMASLPRLRDSMSNGFLSRVFGGGSKEKADRFVEDKKSKHGHDTVLIASESSTGIGRGARTVSQLLRPPQYSNGVDIAAI